MPAWVRVELKRAWSEATLGLADLDARVAFAYAMNQGRGGWQHKHVRHLIDLVYTAL